MSERMWYKFKNLNLKKIFQPVVVLFLLVYVD